MSEQNAEIMNDGDDFEEIRSEEVDTVVAALERIIESTESENIRTILEDASNEIYYLVYEDETGEEPMAEAA
ncbi:hypothetical protein [Calycomorphotria hydatis]|uniref:Uncharacterized protein n=1 Tax=Calycomorphotria hydatis TaxID=2528027 RepID=A0A517T4U3_9PLAN|nr:hypothetical protein [Calycomorphotria hydatis]QDT63384.1 hypothetical protein V22_06050 [Calycomorphotria hydatis]